MKCSTIKINFPQKKLSEIEPGESFIFEINGSPYTRVAIESKWEEFLIMNIYHSNCYYPTKKDLEKIVYEIDSIVNISQKEIK
jgi:hypothetical protein